MNNISIKGILFRYDAVVVIDIVLGTASVALFAGNIPEASLNALETNTGLLLFIMIFGTLSTVIGGFIAARVAKEEIYLNSGMVGVIGIVLGLLVGGEYPIWFTVLSYLSIIPSALLGGYQLVRDKPAMHSDR